MSYASGKLITNCCFAHAIWRLCGLWRDLGLARLKGKQRLGCFQCAYKCYRCFSTDERCLLKGVTLQHIGQKLISGDFIPILTIRMARTLRLKCPALEKVNVLRMVRSLQLTHFSPVNLKHHSIICSVLLLL